MLKSIIKYLFSTALALGLLYWAFSSSNIQWQDIFDTFAVANYQWILLSVIISIFSHILRAWRWEALLDAMNAKKQNLVKAIELFDEFKPKAGSSSMADDEKSLAFRVTLLNPQETLQDAQIEAVMTALLAALEKNCAARLR